MCVSVKAQRDVRLETDSLVDGLVDLKDVLQLKLCIGH